tara:strand:- start:191 stop:457 length:267 start_codon:yes stop_codon:yes gene_type:complete
MVKELKYLFYILIIFLSLFLTLRYYFSDNNKKNSYRSLKNIDEKIIDYSQNLILLTSDTSNVVEYVEKTIDKNKKNYNFWKLISNNEQ